jgi:hypothetical protein
MLSWYTSSAASTMPSSRQNFTMSSWFASVSTARPRGARAVGARSCRPQDRPLGLRHSSLQQHAHARPGTVFTVHDARSVRAYENPVLWAAQGRAQPARAGARRGPRTLAGGIAGVDHHQRAYGLPLLLCLRRPPVLVGPWTCTSASTQHITDTAVQPASAGRRRARTPPHARGVRPLLHCARGGR